MPGNTFTGQYSQSVVYGGRIAPSDGVKQFFVSAPCSNSLNYQSIGGIKYEVPNDTTRSIYSDNVFFDNLNSFSDNLKDDIVNISKNKTNNLLELKPTQFNFKLDLKKNIHYGFIAEDLEKIYPELVKDSENGYKKVNYLELIPLIISKMKEMQDEIDELKKQLEEKNNVKIYYHLLL